MAKCKCDPHEICEECPEWIFTLADLIMCMMGLFVLLWVLKPPPGSQSAAGATAAANATQSKSAASPASAEETWLETVGEIRGAFDYHPDPGSSDPVDQAMIRRRQRNGPGEKGRVEHQTQGAEGTDPEVTNIRSGQQAAVGGHLSFGVGNDALSTDLLHQLDGIAEQVRGHRNIVLVKGHTSADDLPSTATAGQKMDLSLRRAQKVADYLVGKGVSPEIIRVQGCSTFEPVSQRAYTPVSQLLNRRVEVEVTASLVEEFQDPPKNAPQFEGN